MMSLLLAPPLLFAVILAASGVLTVTGQTIILTPAGVQQFQTTPLSAPLGGSFTAMCNGSSLSVYNVDKDRYDSCMETTMGSQPVIFIGFCEIDTTFVILLVTFPFPDRFVQYARGETFYFAAYNNSDLSPAPCLQGVKFAIHVINESTITTTVLTAPSTTLVPTTSTVLLNITSTASYDQGTTTVQQSLVRTIVPVGSTSTPSMTPTTDQPVTRPPGTTDPPITQKPPVGGVADAELEATIAGSVGGVLGILVAIAILAVIAFLLVLIILKHHRKTVVQVQVDGSPENHNNHNPLYEEALGNVDLPTTPKTPKEIRFANMYSDIENFGEKKKRRQTWLF